VSPGDTGCFQSRFQKAGTGGDNTNYEFKGEGKMKYARKRLVANVMRSLSDKVWMQVLSVVFLLSLGNPGRLSAQIPPLPQGCQVISPQAAVLAGFQPQWVIVCVPQAWNGDLVVYAHGYKPPQVPVDSMDNLSLLLQELTFGGQNVLAAPLSSGFAVATTTTRKNGYNIEQGSDDLNLLVQYFKVFVAPTISPFAVHKVFVVGGSEGGLIAALLVEQFPDTYNGGGLALSGPLAGSPSLVKYLGDFRVVFDYFFPQIFKNPPSGSGLPAFGAFDVPPEAVLFWDSVYFQAIGNVLTANPGAREQLFRVTRVARDPKDPVGSAIAAARDLLRYSIFGTLDLISTTGGVPFDNHTTIYFGSANDLALNRGVERVRATGSARQYVNQFYLTTGKLQRPLVTLHNIGDPLIPYSNELVYATRAIFSGSLSLLKPLPVFSYGHANFTAQQVLGAFGLLIQQSGP
jgi:pimeloyl-ACP methyl ester carboxylesterase